MIDLILKKFRTLKETYVLNLFWQEKMPTGFRTTFFNRSNTFKKRRKMKKNQKNNQINVHRS